MEVKIDLDTYEKIEDIANEYQIKPLTLLEQYQALIRANFKQDIIDLAKEIRNENL